MVARPHVILSTDMVIISLTVTWLKAKIVCGILRFTRRNVCFLAFVVLSQGLPLQSRLACSVPCKLAGLAVMVTLLSVSFQVIIQAFERL